MTSIRMIMGVCAGILAFFFGLFCACFLASLIGLPHPEASGTLLWLLFLGWFTKQAYERAKQERLAKIAIVQASVERQAQADREARMVNKELWEQ